MVAETEQATEKVRHEKELAEHQQVTRVHIRYPQRTRYPQP